MGAGFYLNCNNCDYHGSIAEGIGMRFPLVYKDTLKDVKKTQQGETFFKTHPNGAISFKDMYVYCAKCEDYFAIPTLDLYDLKEGKTKKYDYVMERDLKENYVLVEKFNSHCCPECGNTVVKIPNFKKKLLNHQLDCPNCKQGKLSQGDRFLWD